MYPRRFGQIRIKPREAQYLPPAMDTGVPIETAKEDRVQFAGGAGILRRFHHMIQLVRKLTGQVPQG